VSVKKPYPFHYVAGELSLKVQSLEEKVSVKTTDNTFMQLPVIVQYRVSDPSKALYELENPEQQMRSFILNQVKSEANQMSLEDIYSDKTKLQTAIINELGESMQSYGYEIKNVLVDEPELSQELVEAFNQVKAAERQRDAAASEAEAKKKTEVAEAEARRESANAEAAAIKTQRAAEGEAIANHRRRLAEGYAEAAHTLRKAMPDASDNQLLTLFSAIDRHRTLETAAQSDSNTIMLPHGEDASDASAPLFAARQSERATASASS
jgi:regulator of protease activity HflC (stomatin/prohibitin superfamily)